MKTLEEALAAIESEHGNDVAALIARARTEIMEAVFPGLSLEIPRMELEEGLAEAQAAIRSILDSGNVRPYVHVAGGSASGKTSRVADALAKSFRGAATFSFDDYYRGLNVISNEGLTFDDPGALALDEFNAHLGQIRDGFAVQRPRYDFSTSSRVGYREFQAPQGPLIVEGLFALHPEVVAHADFRIFVEASPVTRLASRLHRDIAEGRSGDLREVLAFCLDVVEPKYREHIHPTQAAAQLIIVNNTR